MKSKTNVMRILEQAQVAYESIEYDLGVQDFSGEKVAEILGVCPEVMFKTLTGNGMKNGVGIYLIPVDHELNLKYAASALKDKKVEMIPVKELLSVTGYLRGEVSPIGMKKKYPIFIDDSALSLEKIIVSGGKKGSSILINSKELAEFLQAFFVPLVK